MEAERAFSQGAAMKVLKEEYVCLVQSLAERGFPGGTVVKNPPANTGTRVQALVREDPTCRRATKPVRHDY